MSLFDGFTPTYTFRLQIERSDRTILKTTLVTKATADEVSKAKKTVQRLLNEYTPTFQPTAPVPAQEPEHTGTTAPQEPEAQEEPAQTPDAEPPEEEAAEAANTTADRRSGP